MKIVRSGVFETNSSTTHSLVLFNQIKACGLEIDREKTVTIMLVPLCDTLGNEWQENIVNSLNHASYMVDYIYTRLMFEKYQNKDAQEVSNRVASLIDKMQQYLVELGYKITYKQPLVFTDELNKWNKINIEYNDGSTLQYIEDIEAILKDKDEFNDYLTNYAWVIEYDG